MLIHDQETATVLVKTFSDRGCAVELTPHRKVEFAKVLGWAVFWLTIAAYFLMVVAAHSGPEVAPEPVSYCPNFDVVMPAWAPGSGSDNHTTWALCRDMPWSGNV